MPELNGLIRPKQVLALLGISRSSLYRLCLMGEAAFPQRIRVTKGTVAFSTREVQEWLEAKRHGVPWDPTRGLGLPSDADPGDPLRGARRSPTAQKRRRL